MSHFAAFLCGMMVVLATDTAIKVWFRLESRSKLAIELAIIVGVVISWVGLSE